MQISPHYEQAGFLFGVIGASLLALNTRISPYGWISFLAANVAIILMTIHTGQYWLMAQQIYFTGTSIVGIVRFQAIQQVIADVRTISSKLARSVT